MKSMGIIDSSFNNLPATTRKKINRMTNKALSLEDLIISKLDFSSNIPKIIKKGNYSNTNYSNVNQKITQNIMITVIIIIIIIIIIGMK